MATKFKCTNLLNSSQFTLSNVSESNGIYTFTPNVLAMITYPLPVPIVGHKYYGRCQQLAASGLSVADGRFEYFGGDGVGKNIVFTSASEAIQDSQWHAYSSIQSFPSISGSGWTVRSFTVNATTTFQRKEMLIIDLTNDFGAGNEPSKEWCDSNIPYFTGALWIDYVSDYKKLLTIRINNIKTRLDQELTVRGGQGSVWGYQGWVVTPPSQNGKAFASQVNEISNTFNVINNTDISMATANQDRLNEEAFEKAENWLDTYAKGDRGSTTTGCAASCTGLCSTQCFSSCKGGCSQTCSTGCGGGSTGTKSGTGGSSKGTCGASCASACGGCGGNCAGCTGCTGCTSSCGGGCRSSCQSNCGGSCNADCSVGAGGGPCNTCSGGCIQTCGSNCTGCSGCSGQCNGYCTNACSNDCGGNCSTGCTGCDTTCSACTGSCGSGCAGSCSGKCDSNCKDKCGGDCSATCGNNCQGTNS